jgi:[acyl-carrier-protein] S-malonyltransferase
MLALLGLPADSVEQLCADARRDTGEVVEVANRNTERQTVVSGTAAGLKAVASATRAAGGDAVPLRVSAPFHCSLMSGVAEKFKESLGTVAFLHPQIPVLANTTARPVTDPEDVRGRLADQICGTVRWVDTLRAFSAAGVTAIVEVGPGSVLTALSREAVPDLPAFACSDPGAVEQCARSLSAIPGSDDAQHELNRASLGATTEMEIAQA